MGRPSAKSHRIFQGNADAVAVRPSPVLEKEAMMELEILEQIESIMGQLSDLRGHL
jgi:hypothetical protein